MRVKRWKTPFILECPNQSNCHSTASPDTEGLVGLVFHGLNCASVYIPSKFISCVCVYLYTYLYIYIIIQHCISLCIYSYTIIYNMSILSKEGAFSDDGPHRFSSLVKSIVDQLLCHPYRAGKLWHGKFPSDTVVALIQPWNDESWIR